jgi:protein Shroom
VARLGRKLSVLREEQVILDEETALNDSLGASLQERLKEVERLQEAAKLAHHVEEVGKVTSLLLSLSGRLARAENAIMGLTVCDEKVQSEI